MDFVLKNRALFGSETRYELLNAGRSTHTIGLSSMASMMSSPTAAATWSSFAASTSTQ